MIETGIYKHYKTNCLYFVEGVCKGMLDEKINVLLWPLYLDSKGMRRFIPLTIFNSKFVNEVTKRALVILSKLQEIPLEKMWMLIPGTKIGLTFSEEGSSPAYEVKQVTEKNGGIFVSLESLGSWVSSTEVSIGEFLGGDYFICKNGEAVIV